MNRKIAPKTHFIKFRVSPEEKIMIDAIAKSKGFKDTSKYLRFIAFYPETIIK